MAYDYTSVDGERAELEAAVEARCNALLIERVEDVIKLYPGLRYNPESRTLVNSDDGELAIVMCWGPDQTSERPRRGMYVPTVEQCKIVATVAKLVLPTNPQSLIGDRVTAHFGVSWPGESNVQSDLITIDTHDGEHWFLELEEARHGRLLGTKHYQEYFLDSDQYEFIIPLSPLLRSSADFIAEL